MKKECSSIEEVFLDDMKHRNYQKALMEDFSFLDNFDDCKLNNIKENEYND